MATKNVVEQGRAGNRPVTNELRRAGARISYAPSVEEPETEAELERDDEELDVLRALVKSAELIFEHDGPVTKDPANVLTEALRSAGDDFALLGDELYVGGGTAKTGMFRRAELRCQLALALFEYRSEFGFPVASERLVEEEDEVVS